MRLSAVVAALALLMTIIAAPGISSAVLISYSGNLDSNNQATIDVSFSGSTLTLVLDNTSPLFSPSATGIAFDLPSGVTNITAGTLAPDWGFFFSNDGVNTNQMVGVFDVCTDVSPTNMNCNGGNANDGLSPTEGTFTFTFNVTSSGGLTTDSFVQAMNDFGESAVRFQSTGPLGQDSDVAVPRTNVPEPGTLALIGSGLIGLALVTRRFRK